MVKTPTGINIRFDLCESPPGEHAQLVMQKLGIKYQRAESNPIADSWHFISVDPATIPDSLPSYLTVRRLSIEEWNREIDYLKRHQ